MAPAQHMGGIKLSLAILFCINVFLLVNYSLNLEIGSTSTDRPIGTTGALASGDEAAPPLILAWNVTTGSLDVVQGRNPIDTIRLLGERHSGTTYLTKYLEKCFPQHNVIDYLVRKKHWFQPSPEEILRATQTVDAERLAEATNFERFVPDYKSWWEIARHSVPKRMFQTSLVLLVVRDPYQWMEAMRLRPWHWPNHLRIVPKNETTIATMNYNPDKKEGTRRRRLHQQREGQKSELQRNGDIARAPPARGEKFGGILPAGMSIQKSFVDHEVLDWNDFIRAPMRLEDGDGDGESATVAKAFGTICQKGFPKGTISPCLHAHSYVPPNVSHIPRSFLRNLPLAVNDPVYELKHDTRPFEHPLALRTAKLKNLLNLVQAWDVGGIVVIKYEDVLGGVSDNNSTNLNALVQQIAHVLDTESQCPPHRSMSKTPYVLPEEFARWIGDHADWEIEGRLGYSRGDLT